MAHVGPVVAAAVGPRTVLGSSGQGPVWHEAPQCPVASVKRFNKTLQHSECAFVFEAPPLGLRAEWEQGFFKNCIGHLVRALGPTSSALLPFVRIWLHPEVFAEELLPMPASCKLGNTKLLASLIHG